MPDPKLKEAMEEIKAVIRKYDIAGQVTLATAAHTEYLYELSPSWSCATLEAMPGGRFAIRFRLKRSEFPDPVARKKLAQDTASMLMGIQAMAARVEGQMDALVEMLSKHMNIAHVEWEENS